MERSRLWGDLVKKTTSWTNCVAWVLETFPRLTLAVAFEYSKSRLSQATASPSPYRPPLSLVFDGWLPLRSKYIVPTAPPRPPRRCSKMQRLCSGHVLRTVRLLTSPHSLSIPQPGQWPQCWWRRPVARGMRGTQGGLSHTFKGALGGTAGQVRQVPWCPLKSHCSILLSYHILLGCATSDSYCTHRKSHRRFLRRALAASIRCSTKFPTWLRHLCLAHPAGYKQNGVARALLRFAHRGLYNYAWLCGLYQGSRHCASSPTSSPSSLTLVLLSASHNIMFSMIYGNGMSINAQANSEALIVCLYILVSFLFFLHWVLEFALTMCSPLMLHFGTWRVIFPLSQEFETDIAELRLRFRDSELPEHCIKDGDIDCKPFFVARTLVSS